MTDETKTQAKTAAGERPKRKPGRKPEPAGERAVRLPEELLGRAAGLIPKLEVTPWGDAVRWTETAVIRLAVSRGLARLEDELAELAKSQKAKP